MYRTHTRTQREGGRESERERERERAGACENKFTTGLVVLGEDNEEFAVLVLQPVTLCVRVSASASANTRCVNVQGRSARQCDHDTYHVLYCHTFLKYTYKHTLTLWARAGPGASSGPQGERAPGAQGE